MLLIPSGPVLARPRVRESCSRTRVVACDCCCPCSHHSHHRRHRSDSANRLAPPTLSLRSSSARTRTQCSVRCPKITSANESARESVQWFVWMRYAMIAVTEHDLLALQWTYVGDESRRASSVQSNASVTKRHRTRYKCKNKNKNAPKKLQTLRILRAMLASVSRMGMRMYRSNRWRRFSPWSSSHSIVTFRIRCLLREDNLEAEEQEAWQDGEDDKLLRGRVAFTHRPCGHRRRRQRSAGTARGGHERTGRRQWGRHSVVLIGARGDVDDRH